MSNTHEGVSCDICMKSNFSGKRYKCLICYDFDLCSMCYDQSQVQLNSAPSIQDAGGDGGGKTNKKLFAKSNKQRSGNISQANPIANNIQINQSSHLSTHAMQCILTRSDHELFYGNGGGGIICDFTIGGSSRNEQQAFTCPYCGKCGFSETTLCKHLNTSHSVASNSLGAANASNNTNPNQTIKKEVVCPICAVLPSSNGGDPNHLTDNLLEHINSEHLNNANKNASKNLDDTLNDIGISSLNGSGSTNSSNAAAAAAAALRFSRRLNYSQSSSRTSVPLQSGITIGSSNRANGGAINRYAFQFGQNNGGVGNLSSTNALSSFMRSTSGGTGLDSLSSLSNQIDPIAELLSQLTGVRRAVSSTGSTNNQLQQLQAQLNRERESLQQQSAAAAVIAAAANGQSNGISTRHHHLFSGSNLGANLTKSQLLNSLASSKSNNQNSLNNQNGANQAIQTANNITNAFSHQVLELTPNYLLTQTTTPRDPRYLLSKYDFNSGDNQPPNANLNQINQSIFINDILISILLKQMNENESIVSDTTTAEACQSNSDSNFLNANCIKQLSHTDEDLAEDVLKTTLQTASANVSEIYTKANKSSTVSPEDTKFMEL